MRFSTCRACLLFSLSLMLFSSVSANDGFAIDENILFENITSVYSASKYEQPVMKAPSSVSIVTSDEIKKFGYRNLGDIINSMRVIYTSYDPAYQRAGIREFNWPGNYNYRSMVLVDGHRVNDNLVDWCSIETEFVIDVNDIKWFDLIRALSSSLF